jgi:hypothetical protein
MCKKRIGLSNDELQRLPIERARIERVSEGWRVTLYRKSEHRVHEETLPTRCREELALEDVRFYAPHLYPKIIAALSKTKRKIRDVQRGRMLMRRS